MARADRFDRILNRRAPLERFEEQLKSFNAAAATAGRELTYLVDAMQPIDAEFTKNTFAEADRVKDQFRSNLPFRQFHRRRGRQVGHISLILL